MKEKERKMGMRKSEKEKEEDRRMRTEMPLRLNRRYKRDFGLIAKIRTREKESQLETE